MSPLRPLLLLLVLPVVFAPPARAAVSSAGREADREALRAALEAALAGSPMGKARAALEVVSLDTGERVFSHRGEELLNPASNVKLFTAAAALHLLGPAYRFETALLAEGRPEHGRVKTLYVRGRGDPTLTTERLHGMAAELFHAGLREVGDIACDDSWFDSGTLPPGFDQEGGDNSYLAPPGALSLDSNAVTVYLRGGDAPGAKAAVELEPPAELFDVRADVSTGAPGVRRLNVLASVDGARIRLDVRGVAPPGEVLTLARKVDLPALFTGHALRAVLEGHGIRVKGKVRLASTPPSARVLHAAASDTLDAVLRKLNKHSSNFVAEMLVRSMAAEGGARPGTTAAGVAAVEGFLEREVGLPRGSYVLRNGSGLNDANRFSARQVVRLLSWAAGRFSTMPDYLASLPVAARDGTLRSRMEGSAAANNVRAKTGTLSHVSALGGYLQGASGERLAFSFMVNDYEGRAGPVVQALDTLAAAVASLGGRGGQAPAVAVAPLLGSSPPPLEEAVLAARLRTWSALCAGGDARQAPLLRSALRAEADPALRAAVAAALHGCVPEAGRRAVLEELDPGEACYGRLLRASASAGLPVPGLAALVELAASGEGPAVGRLLQLAAATPVEHRRLLEAPLADAASWAPDAFLDALSGLPDAGLELPLGLVQRGLAGRERPKGLLESLRRAAAGKDGPRASLARAVEGRLLAPVSGGAATSRSP